jgi:exonuclease SbcD
MFDYTALGHLHINQRVGCENVRYSGSPIPLSFSEASSQKKINIVEFKSKSLYVKELDIPLYRTLVLISGDMNSVLQKLEVIKDEKTWIEIHLNDENPFHANQIIRERAKSLKLTLLALKIDKKETNLHSKEFNVISLDELKPLEVFEKRLQKDEIEDGLFKDELISYFKKIEAEVQNS